MLRAALFDLGGTLLHYYDPESDDVQRHFWRITRQGMAQLLAQLAAEGVSSLDAESYNETVERYIGEAYRDAAAEHRSTGTIEGPMRAALAEHGIALDDSRWSSLRSYFYRTIDTIVAPRLGVHETLEALKESGYKIGLISNTFWAADMHDRHLTEHGLIDYFTVRVYSCDTRYSKPHPAIFKDTLTMMGLQPDEAFYVGDRVEVDVAGAQAAGMRGILIRSPYLPSDLQGFTPDAIIDELPDLISTLERIQSPA